MSTAQTPPSTTATATGPSPLTERTAGVIVWAHFMTPQIPGLIANLTKGKLHPVAGFMVGAAPGYPFETPAKMGEALAQLRGLGFAALPGVFPILARRADGTRMGYADWFSLDTWAYAADYVAQAAQYHDRAHPRVMVLDLEPYWEAPPEPHRYPPSDEAARLLDAMAPFTTALRYYDISPWVMPGGLTDPSRPSTSYLASDVIRRAITRRVNELSERYYFAYRGEPANWATRYRQEAATMQLHLSAQLTIGFRASALRTPGFMASVYAAGIRRAWIFPNATEDDRALFGTAEWYALGQPPTQ